MYGAIARASTGMRRFAARRCLWPARGATACALVASVDLAANWCGDEPRPRAMPRYGTGCGWSPAVETCLTAGEPCRGHLHTDLVSRSTVADALLQMEVCAVLYVIRETKGHCVVR